MKLKCLDTLHVSAVKMDSLRPGEQFHISDAAGADLLKAHPTKFEIIKDDNKKVSEVAEKAEPSPKNKAEDAPANKADEPVSGRKTKAKDKSEA